MSLQRLRPALRPFQVRRNYSSYRSPHGPAYRFQPHFLGITTGDAVKYGVLAAGLGGAAGTFALFFFAEIPRVSRDIMQKVPFLGDFFVKEIAPEDNPF